MRSRSLVTALVTLSVFAVPVVAYAAIPFFGPIIPDTSTDHLMANCAAGWGGLIIVINRIISLAITLGIVFIAPLAIAYAGFLYVINPISPSGRSQANKLMFDIVIGIVVMLCSWLIVDAVMAVLYNPKSFGPEWYALITTNGEGYCIPNLPVAFNQSFNPPQQGFRGGVSGTGIPLAPGAIENLQTGCTASELYSTFQQYAAAMSCATRYEDPSCTPGQPSGSDKTLANEPVSIGILQVNLTTNNLNYPSCERAVGATGNLNCKSAFSGQYTSNTSRVSVIDPGLYNKCVLAASNLDCNKDAALTAFNDRKSRGSNPLGAWGKPAQDNCTSLLPANTAFNWHSMLSSVVVSFTNLFSHE